MANTISRTTRRAANRVLSVVGLQLIKPRQRDHRDYIPCGPTIEAARAAGLSVGDYIDQVHNVAGCTADTIDRLAALGVFAGTTDAVCEIGPGSGRYLEKVIQACRPARYEIYETAREWREYLARTYPVVVQPTDGVRLAATPSASVDLVHSHKVMPGLATLVMCRYFAEMVRVVRPGGKIVFDLVTERCLDDETLSVWLEQPGAYQHHPCLMPAAYATSYFERRGCSLDGTFVVPMKPGTTEYFVFTQRSPHDPVLR